VASTYEIDNGEIRLDLTRLSDPEALAGREIDLSLHAGEIVVIVPKELNVSIDAEFDFAGGIEVPGYQGGGIGDHVRRYVAGFPASTLPALDLELDAFVGHLQVEQR
jgi:predicted membrane protein